VRSARSCRNWSKVCFQAAAWVDAVWVRTPSRSKRQPAMVSGSPRFATERTLPLVGQGGPDLPGDLQVLAGGDHQGADRRPRRADVALDADGRLVLGRVDGRCSPIPPVKTRTSTPSRAATMAATPARRRWTRTSTASRARSSPSSRAASTSRRSPEVPESPRRPASCSSPWATSSTERPAVDWSHSRAPGSTEPDRVAMTRPSSGVNPIVVSTERPPDTAHREAPAPRWQVTVRSSSTGRPTSAAARREAHRWLRPWKP